MTHKAKIYDHEHNDNNSQTFWIKVFYDHDGDGEKEVIWDDKVTYSDHQVTPQEEFERRVSELAEKKVQEFEEETPDGSKYIDNEVAVDK